MPAEILHQQPPHQPRDRALGGGSVLEALLGAGAIVLAIVALTGFASLALADVATIIVGAGLLVHGATVLARRKAITSRGLDDAELGGFGGEVLGGLAAIALGVVALDGVAPTLLLAIAAIAVGASIVTGASVQAELARWHDDAHARALYAEVETPGGALTLVGLGAIVLGILALLRVAPVLPFVIVAMLALGAAQLLSGTTIATRVVRRS